MSNTAPLPGVFDDAVNRYGKRVLRFNQQRAMNPNEKGAGTCSSHLLSAPRASLRD
jgi:hypothetical protein